MAYAALDIAKWFINSIDRASGESISHLKVQKLLYYAEGWSQISLNQELFRESIQAWAHGPVVPEVFRAFRDCGWEAIPVQQLTTEIDPDTTAVLQQVLDIYGEFSAKTLENMTHADAPWLAARGGLPPEARCETVMPKEGIRDFFEAKFGAAVG